MITRVMWNEEGVFLRHSRDPMLDVDVRAMRKREPRKSRLTPEQRSTQARIASLMMHAKNNSKETSAPARKAFMARFEREVDPDGTLDAKERARRAELAKRAYFTRLGQRRQRSR
jgi:hypothetical protein